jgi:predicted nucleotidyltransferase
MGINIPNMGALHKLPKRIQTVSMADALFSTTQQRVLAHIYGQPERSFYLSELIRLSSGGSGAIQRELTRLEQSGLVTVTRIGSQKHYQANPNAPIYNELCGIVQKTVGLAEPLREVLKPLTQQITTAFVYGSVAKRTDTAASDIDLMLISDTLNYADVFAALENASPVLGRSINPTVYSNEEFMRRIIQGNSFIKRVLKQPKLWIIGRDNDIPTG